MERAVSAGEGGMKVRPELMETDTLYHCIAGGRLMLVYRDAQEIMHCYEVDDESLLKAVRSCPTYEEASRLLERMGEGGMNRVINQQDPSDATMSADSDAARVYSEYTSSGSDGAEASPSTTPERPLEMHPEGAASSGSSDSCGCHGEGGSCEGDGASGKSGDRPEGGHDSHGEGHGDSHGADGAKEGEGQKQDNEPRDRSVVLIGIKPIMTYVTATLTQLATLPKITIKARGKRITQAVDVSQMIVKRMNTVGYQISDVRIASDSFTGEDGRNRKISTMEIDIIKS